MPGSLTATVTDVLRLLRYRCHRPLSALRVALEYHEGRPLGPLGPLGPHVAAREDFMGGLGIPTLPEDEDPVDWAVVAARDPELLRIGLLAALTVLSAWLATRAFAVYQRSL